SRQPTGGLDEPPTLEPFQDRTDRAFDVDPIGPDLDLGVVWRLVRVRHAGELRELASQRSSVEALRVASGELLERAVQEDLDERRLVRSPDLAPHLAVRCDR